MTNSVSTIIICVNVFDFQVNKCQKVFSMLLIFEYLIIFFLGALRGMELLTTLTLHTTLICKNLPND